MGMWRWGGVEFHPGIAKYGKGGIQEPEFSLKCPVALMGSSYRLHPVTARRSSATPEQKAEAEAVIAELIASKQFASPIVTEVTEATIFYPAEDYHRGDYE